MKFQKNNNKCINSVFDFCLYFTATIIEIKSFSPFQKLIRNKFSYKFSKRSRTLLTNKALIMYVYHKLRILKKKFSQLFMKAVHKRSNWVKLSFKRIPESQQILQLRMMYQEPSNKRIWLMMTSLKLISFNITEDSSKRMI